MNRRTRCQMIFGLIVPLWGLAQIVPLWGLTTLPSAAQDGPKLESISNFYVVRHAEKTGPRGDVPLTREGHWRAAELRELLRTVPLAAVYSTDYLRTRDTAAPTAVSAGLELELYPPEGRPPVSEWAAALIERHLGQNVLISSHSGGPQDAYSVASIVQELTGEPVAAIPESDYTNLYQVTITEYGEGEARELRRHRLRHRFGPLKQLGTVAVEGELVHERDVSALLAIEDLLLVGVDEGDAIQVLKRVDPSRAIISASHRLGSGKELDIESMARVGTTVYALGSHSRTRPKVAPYDLKTLRRSYRKNRQRLLADSVKTELPRRSLYRFTFDPTSATPLRQKVAVDLTQTLAEHPILGMFHNIPGKENGIDLEGLAAVGDALYLGFRSPLLRSGFAPILRLTFERPQETELSFVDLGGRGVRELVAVADGFLIVAGPSNDAPLSYLLYHWDGQDMIPGRRGDGDPALGRVLLLGRIPTPPGAKAEGMTVLATTPEHYELLIAYDSAAGGGMRILQAPRVAADPARQ